MVTRNIQFGELETRLLFKLEEADTAIVRTNDIMNKLDISKKHANKLAWQLAKKNRLIRIRKGFYLFAPLKAGPKGEWSEASFLIVSELLKNRDYYIGFWSALNHYHLTEQIPVVTQVVVAHRRRSFNFLGNKIEFVHTKKFGEWREEEYMRKKVKVATIEQLIIDCLAYPEYCGGLPEASKAVWEARDKVDWKKLEELALKSSDAVRRRLGYLLEIYGLRKLNIHRGSLGWRWLDPSGTKNVKAKSAKWGLFLNLTEKQLKDWMES